MNDHVGGDNRRSEDESEKLEEKYEKCRVGKYIEVMNGDSKGVDSIVLVKD
jgi:hypothetical protein